MNHWAAVREMRIDDREMSGGGSGNVSRETFGRETLLRAADIFLSLAALFFLAPLMFLIGMAVSLSDGGPVFFGHKRIGRGGHSFRCLKFRSMAVDAEARLQALLDADEDARKEWEKDHKLRNDPRITPLGRFLRKTSFDELPQFVNVLRGDMSLVGPRPIVTGEMMKYGRYFSHYCSVRPGITGLWQVTGRNDVSYRRRVALDVMFSRRKSAVLYFYVLCMTVPAVLKSEGSY